ncbi:hypothetical protein KKF70_05935 [bacterium]|nr:hypothetical protein [Candidatus Omnitrophota bacterium]MBU2528907.1 hypothetical protein [bacterium]MBU3929982.1 hypothetical protein [bacterium]MBU4122936.1 hypothetical protein [bacterium]
MADGVFRKIPVEIEILGGRIVEGVINLPTAGYKTRLSDFINDATKSFIPMANAIISKNGQLEKKYHSIIISKSAIIHIVELEQKED